MPNFSHSSIRVQPRYLMTRYYAGSSPPSSARHAWEAGVMLLTTFAAAGMTLPMRLLVRWSLLARALATSISTRRLNIQKQESSDVQYVYVQISPDRIEDGNYEVINGNELRLEHTGGGVSKCRLREGDDPARVARRLLRAHVEERGAFWDPLPQPTKRV